MKSYIYTHTSSFVAEELKSTAQRIKEFNLFNSLLRIQMKKSYLSLVYMGVIEGQTEKCSKYRSGSPGLGWSRERSSPTSTSEVVQDGRKGGQEYGSNHHQDQVDNSFQKVMFLNCWTQS